MLCKMFTKMFNEIHTKVVNRCFPTMRYLFMTLQLQILVIFRS
jgi:hypothetical protein